MVCTTPLFRYSFASRSIPLKKSLGNRIVLQWIRERSNDAEVTASVCTGASFLAEAGLIDGKRATIHHAVLDQFTYPEVRVCRGRRVVDEGGHHIGRSHLGDSHGFAYRPPFFGGESERPQSSLKAGNRPFRRMR